MLKRLTIAILFSSLAFAGDSYLGQTYTPYATVVKGATWAGSAGPFCNQGGCTGGGINNNYIWLLQSPDSTVCVAFANNNTTSAHTITVSLLGNLDPSQKVLTGNSGRWYTMVGTTSTGTTGTILSLTVGATAIQGIAFQNYGTAIVALSISGGVSQAGSPDTVDVYAVQTKASNCFFTNSAIGQNTVQGPYKAGTSPTANQIQPFVVGGLNNAGVLLNLWLGNNNGTQGGIGFDTGTDTPDGLSSNFRTAVCAGGVAAFCQFRTTPLGTFQTNVTNQGYQPASPDGSDFALNAQFQLRRSFSVNNVIAAPAANGVLLHLFVSNTSTFNLPLKSVRINNGNAAAVHFQIKTTTAKGTTCTALALVAGNNSSVGAATAPDAQTTAEFTCTGAPTALAGGTLYDEFLAPNASVEIPLDGFALYGGAGPGAHGIEVLSVTALGPMAVTLKWSQE